MNNLTRWQRPDLSAWPTFGKLFGLRNELERLFDVPFSELAQGSNLLSIWNPAIDVYEDKDNVTVKAELPGMKKEEIEVSLHDGALVISGERKSEEKFENAETYRAERFVGRFHRTVTLPSSVKGDQVKAQYKDGILTITLPKAEEAKPKQIEVNIA
ncbi:Hsp20/alpha crystallin family protein [Pedosphaera parvula]|uniref:Heat shock protein Hsp20 n=1 Tax=Pedosphaera parvula (strain Ellin514) TaxID=320771 RepID=B9XRD8_PEDPL|nr:Hsp20/alpha crystallin family protein [Pedosphaera parvula]EEF57572.1 heat shock protein Hsp20 [Pedosphaera parvula Ellin514]